MFQFDDLKNVAIAMHKIMGITETKRDEQERAFEALIDAYIDNAGRRFSFGGVHNLVATIARACEKRSQIEGDDWEKAAIALDNAADAVDLKYLEAE